MRRLIAAVFILCAPVAPALAQTPSTPDAWHGTWQGTLVNFPGRRDAVPVEVTREIGVLPTADSSCAALRTTYREAGVVRGVKDYRLCRGRGPEDWYVDEGGGLTLSARWLGDALVASFKYDALLLVTTMRLRGDLLEEEILTVDDRPAVQGPLSLGTRSLQRLTLRRVADSRR
ncbi:MAG: hypothetical protein ACK6DP_20000 [Gemmatimonas sp.]|jgi:hypothetical protein|uniref:hypothetical protein n=1 Tax=Gemmatimonas sp. TaxID=1962908 RepID=UPI00391FA32A|nr:hypothetical protein [Gemmatimonadota bacterium]